MPAGTRCFDPALLSKLPDISARSPRSSARWKRRPACHASTITTSRAFEVTSKRRKGFPSETRVKRGLRFVRGGEKELVEKLGRNDPCP